MQPNVVGGHMLVLQVIVKMFLDNLNAEATIVVERQVQMLRGCERVCQICGVTVINQKACIILQQHHSLAEELAYCVGMHILPIQPFFLVCGVHII